MYMMNKEKGRSAVCSACLTWRMDPWKSLSTEAEAEEEAAPITLSSSYEYRAGWGRG
jgi:hypothetical protein